MQIIFLLWVQVQDIKFSIVDNILVVGYEADGKDHDKQYGGCCRDIDRLM